MTSSSVDLRTLRRSSAMANRAESPEPDSPSSDVAVPRPRVRWVTRVAVPLGVLFATGGILLYAGRDALQSRLPVHVAAVIPKAHASDELPAQPVHEPQDDARLTTDAPLGAVVVQAPGWIEPAPFAVSVPALAEGVVKEVLVLEGERVEAGQVVTRLIDDDAKLSLRAAEANVAERLADTERAQAALAAAESQVQVERSSADELRDEVTRKRQLVNAGGVSAGEFRRLEIRLEGLDAKVAAAERAVSEAQAACKQAEAAQESATVMRDEAQLRLTRMEVRSPVDGVVLTRLVEPGSRISMGSKSGDGAGSMSGTVIRVYDPAKLQVRVDVPLADAAKVGVGTRALVSTEALAEQSFTGTVTRVIHEANIQRNTVQFKVLLDQPTTVLKPEMLTRVKLHAPTTASQRAGGDAPNGVFGADYLLVPTNAVISTSEGKGRVWIVDASDGSPVARQRDIAISPATDVDFVIATSGLQLTDRVILDPSSHPTIKEGMRLKVLGEQPATTP